MDNNGPSTTVTARRIPPGVLLALRIFASALVIGAFLWALVGQAQEIASYDWQLSPLWLVAALLVALARGPLVAYPWWRIVYSWGYGFPWWRGMRVYFHSGLARYIPGQYWFILSRALLAEHEGVPKRVTAASTLAETLVVTGAAGGVALIGLQRVPDLPETTRWLLLLGGIIAPLLLAALISSTPASHAWSRLARLMRYDLPRPRLAWDDASWTIVAAYANWSLYGLVAALSLAGVAADPTQYLTNVPAIIGCFAASVLGAAVFLFIPQGIVVREGIFVYLLNTLLAVPIPEAIAAAALTRLIATVAEGIWAAIALKF